ncbi:hypothetical protein EVAR_48604_1, partial [Eumeta japonica]
MVKWWVATPSGLENSTMENLDGTEKLRRSLTCPHLCTTCARYTDSQSYGIDRRGSRSLIDPPVK